MKFFNSSIWLVFFLAMTISCKDTSNKNIAANHNAKVQERPIVNSILEDKESFYYIDFQKYPEMNKNLPIGVFDSGTGGLTVLDAIVNFNKYNNKTQSPGKDTVPDFNSEEFIFLADQANMPYGNYSSENKDELLIEHILKDTQFLLGNKYYPNAEANSYKTNKKPVKSIVIACNTATAYGGKLVNEFIAKTAIDLKVIGVIDAGARGTLSTLEKDENGSIGVMATVGTIKSKGYKNTLLRFKEKLGYTGNIQIFNQGGHGIAEAVDEVPDFIDRDLEEPRPDYRGPSLNHPEFKIDKTLLNIYNFNFDHNKMLCDTQNTDDCQILQINDTENYVRYHVVSLLEKIRKANNPPPLKAIVLGCTHYPYLTEEINMVLNELYNYKKDGKYVYRPVMNEKITIVDPAINVAEELYVYLKEKNILNPKGNIANSEFYISIPNTDNSNVVVNEKMRFPYEYKYGRTEGKIQEYVKIVPFSKNNISKETLKRLRNSVPETFNLIKEFSQTSNKTEGLKKVTQIDNAPLEVI